MLLAMVPLASFAQTFESTRKAPQIGFSANLVDFTATKVTNGGNYDPSASLFFWNSLSNKIDYSFRYNAVWTPYSKVYSTTTNQALVSEFELSFHGRLWNDNHFVQPFATAGAGIGNYSQSWAAYFPLGLGIQVNLFSEGYVFIQSNYRVSACMSKLDDNMFYSVGFSTPIGHAKQPKKPKLKPLPSPPVAKVINYDKDGDGVPDSVDMCPDVAGLAALHGCPDRDGDGIADKDDKCPDIKGLAKYHGCPIPDTDGDGINDEEDSCPSVPGLARYHGCPIPDTDGDGVNDEEDKCPTVAGTIANHGCPEVKEEIKKKVELSAKNIYFAPASDKIVNNSFKSLDQVVAVLNEDKNLKLDISGYTDNTGKPESNLQLSKDRAKAVYVYLVSKGIDAKRLSSEGYGEAHSVADNKTAEGRLKNRRVELKLKY